MGVRKHVFGSNSERAYFYKLSRQWGEKYRLYHNLPFLDVFDTDGLRDYSGWPSPSKPFQITDIERNRLKKTSIDFTLCGENDKPLVCIEFDGMQEGFNVGTAYKSPAPPNPWRDEIMELKLRVAHGSLFPFFVLGSRYFDDMSQSVQFRIVDGIIGDVLASQAVQERAQQGFTPEEAGIPTDEFEGLSPQAQDEVIQDWLLGVEVEADIEHNPIYAVVYELWKDLSRKLGSVRHTTRYVYAPAIDPTAPPKERARKMNAATMMGAVCTVHTQQYEDITETVWLPNFRTPGYSGLGLVEEIAHLAALDSVRKRVSR